MKANKKLGNDFETEFCEILFNNGFWCHNLAQNAAGQPADVIAVRDGKAYLVDCKVCSGRGFALSRVEENQELSMELWQQCGNGAGWFAFLLGEDIYMLSAPHIKLLSGAQSVLTKDYIRTVGRSIEDWLRECG